MTPDDRFDHLVALSDGHGLFEHAEGLVPRPEHGYCTDDNARLLALTSLQRDAGAPHRLGRLALHFLSEAQGSDGRCRNRMDASGRWTDQPGTEDCWGRSLWGLGWAAVHHENPAFRHCAQRMFDNGASQRSPWSRAMAFAAVGAADVLVVDRDNERARSLLHDAVEVIGVAPSEGPWRWPEPRLRYANATLAEAMIAAGAALDSPAHLDQGLTMLRWLLDLETAGGHLSVTGTSGRGRGDDGPQFDQQSIEVAAMADACWRALTVTGDDEWRRGIVAATAWFHGENDAGLVMFDVVSQGGYDGLHADRVNLNQGAESTLAYVSTMHRAAGLELPA